MSYIGKTPTVGNFVKLDAITTSSTNTYKLLNGGVAFTPESANHMIVSLNGVIQAPSTAFSVSGSTITFLPSSGTLSSSDVIDFILVLGNVLDIGSPSDGTVTNAKTNFISTSSNAGLSIKGDGTTSGTGGQLQLNCSNNNHGIKLESPAHSAGQSYTLKFPTGNVTAGTVLTVDSVTGSGTTGVGQLSFAGGGLVKLLSATWSSPVAEYDITSSTLTSAYDNYLIVWRITPSTDNTSLRGRFSTDGGSSFISTSGYYGHEFTNTGNSVSLGSNSQTYMVLSYTGMGNDTGEMMSGQLYLRDINNTTYPSSIFGSITYYSTSGYHGGGIYSGGQTVANRGDAVNGFRFATASGNLENGEVTVYGFTK